MNLGFLGGIGAGYIMFTANGKKILSKYMRGTDKLTDLLIKTAKEKLEKSNSDKTEEIEIIEKKEVVENEQL